MGNIWEYMGKYGSLMLNINESKVDLCFSLFFVLQGVPVLWKRNLRTGRISRSVHARPFKGTSENKRNCRSVHVVSDL